MSFRGVSAHTLSNRHMRPVRGGFRHSKISPCGPASWSALACSSSRSRVCGNPAEDDLPDSAPAYSAAASPTTAPEATPDPVPVTTPTIPYDGDCDALLTAADVGTIVGQLSVLAPYEGARVPEVDVSAGTLGGLACEWYGDWRPRMMAFPVDLVPADIAARYTDVVCEGISMTATAVVSPARRGFLGADDSAGDGRGDER